MVSTTSNQQLCLQLTISYNKTLQKKLYNRPKVRAMNNLSIPHLDSESEGEEDMDTT